jgi:hypothetical protein
MLSGGPALRTPPDPRADHGEALVIGANLRVFHVKESASTRVRAIIMQDAFLHASCIYLVGLGAGQAFLPSIEHGLAEQAHNVHC